MKKSYIVAIDYRATYKPMTTDYKVLEADNLLDAMSEAESYLDTEKVYLLIIMQADKAGHKVKGMHPLCLTCWRMELEHEQGKYGPECRALCRPDTDRGHAQHLPGRVPEGSRPA